MSLYLDRYGWKNPLFTDYLPNPQLEMVIVIPCYNETRLQDALQSLCNALKPCRILVLVIVNESEKESELIQRNNTGTVELLKSSNYNFELLFAHLKLPTKKAGVGLARKIGMDEAIRFFEKIDKDGIIVCYDADCICSNNYLEAIYDFYRKNPFECGIVFYEHRLNEHPKVIIDYEIHLRYYITALRWAGFLNAFQTLGSCITVKSKRYQKEGGMNTRKAGEDFYFLHKLIPNGKFGEINRATIFPSDRVSDRVPFGTGHAIDKNLDKEMFETYNPKIFEELKLFFSSLKVNTSTVSSPRSEEFLDSINFTENLNRIQSESSDPNDFMARFFRWFDGFKVLKLVHHLRDEHFSNVPIDEALKWLQVQEIIPPYDSKSEALSCIRNIDRFYWE